MGEYPLSKRVLLSDIADYCDRCMAILDEEGERCVSIRIYRLSIDAQSVHSQGSGHGRLVSGPIIADHPNYDRENDR